MGERTGRIDLSDNHKTRPPSPDEAVRLLGAEIAELREELGGLVTELDRRRHDGHRGHSHRGHRGVDLVGDLALQETLKRDRHAGR